MNTIHKTLDDLKRGMVSDHIAVNESRNPFAIDIKRLTLPQLRYVVGQYSIFPRHIVGFLYAARDSARASHWAEAASELTRNMGEELGTETGGQSHYELLIEGVADAARSPSYLTLKELKPSAATGEFLARVANATRRVDVAYALGATYALEGSAVPELLIVRDLVNRFLKEAGAGPMIGTLKAFFDLHVGTWEPGHEQGLYDAIPKYLPEEKAESFRAGFEEVMNAMDIWWEGLYQEVKALQ